MVCLTVLVLVGLAEAAVRAAGYRPFGAGVRTSEPQAFAPDPELGWRNRPGAHVLPSRVPGGMPVTMTIGPDGSRATGPAPADRSNAPTIVFVGCSYTQGWAIPDEETLAWRVQQRYPQAKVINLGTGGFGTYQSLLLLERELRPATGPLLVVYGFIQHHEMRNAAPLGWLELLAADARSGSAAVPFVTVGQGGALVRHPPEPFGAFPLRTRLALAAFAETQYRRRLDGGRSEARMKDRVLVTQRLLADMDRLVRTRGGQLGVVVLDADRGVAAQYGDYLRRRGINVVDCNFALDERLRVPGDGHPNGVMNARWADCLGRVLDGALAPPAGAART